MVGSCSVCLDERVAVESLLPRIEVESKVNLFIGSQEKSVVAVSIPTQIHAQRNPDKSMSR